MSLAKSTHDVSIQVLKVASYMIYWRLKTSVLWDRYIRKHKTKHLYMRQLPQSQKKKKMHFGQFY